MLRVMIEMVPGGDEERKYTLGLIEIANISSLRDVSNYAVVLKKCPPYKGALQAAWKKAKLTGKWPEYMVQAFEDDEIIVQDVRGFNRVQLGCYDLLFRAMEACGLARRNPRRDT